MTSGTSWLYSALSEAWGGIKVVEDLDPNVLGSVSWPIVCALGAGHQEAGGGIASLNLGAAGFRWFSSGVFRRRGSCSPRDIWQSGDI